MADEAEVLAEPIFELLDADSEHGKKVATRGYFVKMWPLRPREPLHSGTLAPQ